MPRLCLLQPATWYISIQYTQPENVQMLYMKGHEVATHTFSHAGLPNATEIVSAKTWLNQVGEGQWAQHCGSLPPVAAHAYTSRDVQPGVPLASPGWGPLCHPPLPTPAAALTCHLPLPPPAVGLRAA